MIAKNPLDRPQTPAELRRELDECIDRMEDGAPQSKADSSGTASRSARGPPRQPAQLPECFLPDVTAF